MEYPVKRGSRFDKISLAVVYDWVIEGMNTVEGISSKEALSVKGVLNRSLDYIVGHQDIDMLHMYSRIVVYSDVNENGKRGNLTTSEGEEFTIPTVKNSPAELAGGYYKWLKIDVDELQSIDAAILEANKMLAPRHSKPTEMLTDEEKADPNSPSVGV